MISIKRILPILTFLVSTWASAQLATTGAGGVGGAGYTGPGDLVAFTAWYGNRAYNKTIANAGTTAAARFIRDSDSHLCDILVGAAGLTTTSNCSTGGDNGTVVGTWCNATTCRYTIWYDQTGGGLTITASATNSQRPTYSAAALGGRSCANFVGTNSSQMATSGSLTFTTPMSLVAVASTALAVTANYEQIVGALLNTGGVIYYHNGGLLDSTAVASNASNSRIFTTSDGNAHSFVSDYSGASSILNIDGVDSATFTTGSFTGTSLIYVGYDSNASGHLLTGCIGEIGGHASSILGANRAAVGANQSAWYAIPSPTGIGSYTGPIDAVAGASSWWGLRGASQAYANGVNHGAIIRRASDNALLAVPILATGDFNTAAATAFAGTDAVCTGAIAATTLTVASCSSGTLHAGDQIADANIADPTFITALGTGSGGIGTYTVNKSQTAASATFTATVAMYAEALPDQGGNGLTFQTTTAANQAELLVNCLNTTKPCLYFNGTSDGYNIGVAVAQPVTVTAVGDRLGNTGSTNQLLWSSGSSVGFFTANLAYVYGGGTLGSAAAADLSPHSMSFGLSGASSFLNVDGVSAAAASAGSSSFTALYMGTTSGPSQWMTGYEPELGVWPSLFSAGNQSIMHTNMSVYWGTP